MYDIFLYSYIGRQEFGVIHNCPKCQDLMEMEQRVQADDDTWYFKGYIAAFYHSTSMILYFINKRLVLYMESNVIQCQILFKDSIRIIIKCQFHSRKSANLFKDPHSSTFA